MRGFHPASNNGVRIPIATKLILSFLLIIAIISVVFSVVGVQVIGNRIVAEAQEKVRTDLNSAREIFEKMAGSYHVSTVETARTLGVELKELEDWNCCGATAYFHIDELLAYTLCARNLAMAEREHLDLVAPCSGCYKNMYFTNVHLKKEPELAEHINFALKEDNLHFSGTITVRHLIEAFVNDVGITEIKRRVTRPLNGLRVAPYYGCQLVRPRKDHEDVEQPQFFEDLLSALGAVPVNYPLKLCCCGGSLIVTNRKAALTMVHHLLQSAVDHDAEVIATVCPLCQINLECYQKQVNREFGTKFSTPVMYFTQLLGLALGIPPKRLGIGTEVVSTTPALCYAQKRGPGPTAEKRGGTGHERTHPTSLE